jgi:hypothetical protein
MRNPITHKSGDVKMTVPTCWMAAAIGAGR